MLLKYKYESENISMFRHFSDQFRHNMGDCNPATCWYCYEKLEEDGSPM
jgi:hypothetical protein